MEKVISHSDFLSRTSGSDKSLLLLYKAGSEQSTCALKNIEKVENENPGISIYTADVVTVRDIHQVYGVSSVPALLVFAGGKLTSIIKGCQESSYYRALTENSLFVAGNKPSEKAARRVTVYSTPTCSWCNTLKAWLKKNNITYTDIDVSRDQKAAEELVKRSGQQGVPQTEINGQIVVGFNQPKLKELLEIQ
jgi:glutaredoxin-like YruB-family protein